jgi:hypothetical protein
MFPEGYLDEQGRVRVIFQFFDRAGNEDWATLFIVYHPGDTLELLKLEAEEFALNQRARYGETVTIGDIDIVPVLPFE